MKAIVKNIPIGTTADIDGLDDDFTEDMAKLIGREIEVEPLEGYSGWYISHYVEAFTHNWNWHESWLEFVEEHNG
jgi:hypothetical protein